MKTITEAAFQRQVVQFARLCGWTVYHTFDSRRSDPGFPDLVMVRAGRPVVYAELKTVAGRVRPEQAKWLELLRLTPSQVFLWRPTPECWAEIERVLGDGTVKTKGVLV